MRRLLLLICYLSGLMPAATRAAEAFELKDGDRVVLLGNTLIERDQSHGYLETILTCRYPDRTITFRNLGWSGDDVFGHARAGFDPPASGFPRLVEHVTALRPTVLLVGYGANEAFEGPSGLPRFRSGFDQLLAALARTGGRIVLLSPLRQEDLGRPLPDPVEHNKDLSLYRDAIAQTATARGYPFVDLYGKLGYPDLSKKTGDGDRWSIAHPLTDNGIHLTAYGYWLTARAIVSDLGLDATAWNLSLNNDGTARGPQPSSLSHVQVLEHGLRFAATAPRLPGPTRPEGPPMDGSQPRVEGGLRLQIGGLPPGRYTLMIDGRPVTTLDAGRWGGGVLIDRGPESDQVERLRAAIVRKDRLYFYRWRPQNETYLFGFRKHEQGQNAREIPLFDPLVAAQEAIIARLKVPVAHTYELTREGEVAQ